MPATVETAPAPAGPLVGGLQRSTRIRGAVAVPPGTNLRYAPGLFGIRLMEVVRAGGGGDEETRTPDPLLAKEMLCRLSYVPMARRRVVGVSGLEPETSALSGQCSNQLS